MTLKADKLMLFVNALLAAITLLCALVFLHIGGMIPATVFFILAMTRVVFGTISTARTIHVNADGCIIELWRYRKKYTWSEMAVKRIEPPHIGLRLQYHNGGVFFSLKPVKKPIIMAPSSYCALLHPLTSFYVYFTDSKSSPSPRLYDADRKEFLSLMDQYSVILEDPYKVHDQKQ